MLKTTLLFFTKLFNPETIVTILSALAGGVVSVIAEKERIPLFRSLALIFGGFAGAIFIGGAINQYYNLSGDYASAVVFGVGGTFLRIFEWLLLVWDQVKKDPKTILKMFSTKFKVDITTNESDEENKIS